MKEELEDLKETKNTDQDEDLDLLDKNEEDENEDQDEDKDEDQDEDEEEDLESEEEEEEAIAEGRFSMAIVRIPSPTLADGLTTSNLGRADYGLFITQHLSYTAVLRSLNLKILKLPSLPDLPDAHFIEDVAVITPDVAVITRPGAAERLPEIEHIRDILSDLRPLAAIEEPGTLEGGDVMQIEQTVYVGLSERTNEKPCQLHRPQHTSVDQGLGFTPPLRSVRKDYCPGGRSLCGKLAAGEKSTLNTDGLSGDTYNAA
jgi:hypothetical protein